MLPLRSIALLTLICFVGSISACTSCRKLPIHSAAEMPQIDPQKKYQIEFTNDKKEWRVKGDQLILRDDLVGIRLKEEQDYKYYKKEQIKSFCIEQFSKGKTIGAVLGGVAGLGGILAAIIVVSLRMSGPDRE